MESKVMNMNTNCSAAATIASEDEDYKHMDDVEEPVERMRQRREYADEPISRTRQRIEYADEPISRTRQRIEYAEEPIQKQRSRPRKAAWTEQRLYERMR
jgi:hypothetical protein